MKILVISPRVYPKDYNPFGNNFFDHTRAIDVINYLPQNSTDEITLITLDSPEVKFDFFNKKVTVIQIKRKFKRPNYLFSKILIRLGMAVPDFFSSLYTFIPQFSKDTQPYIDECDVVFFTTSTAIFPTIYARFKQKFIINDPFGSFFQLNLRNIHQTSIYLIPIWLLKTLIAYLIEWFTFKLSDIVIVFNEIHQQYFKKYYFLKDECFKILPIKIATTEVPNINNVNKYRQKFNINKSDQIMLFIGNFTIPQNSAPLNQIIGLLNNLPKNYKLLVAGPTLSTTINHPQVIYAGFISDLENIVEMSSICLAPTDLGSGIKTKILLYLLQDKPVITSIRGANFLPELKNIFIGKVTEQITSQYLQKIISQKHSSGHQFVIKNFSPDAFAIKLNLIYQHLDRIFTASKHLKNN